MPTFVANINRSKIEWIKVFGDPMAPVDAVLIHFHLDDPHQNFSKEAITSALKLAVERGELPWLSIQNCNWIFDMDILRDSFTLLHDFDSLKGRHRVRELFKPKHVRDYGFDLYYNHLEFKVPVPQESATTYVRELEQKFGILFSVPQEAKDFTEWTIDGELLDLQVACLFVDIDYFKKLNTKYTETRIDATILPEVQRILERLVRHRGYAYRHGGEEFLILLPNHTADEGLTFAERLRETIEETVFHVEEHSEHITVSVGVAFFPEHGVQLEEVVLMANEAKQTAKNEGRNRVAVASTKGAA